jgi:hypothetical protein
MAGETVYRRQYSGRNVDKLRESIDELAEGMVEPHMTGRRDLFLGQDECTLAADDGELFVTPQAPRELSIPHDKPTDDKRGPLYLASFGASHWDALAIGRTRLEASTALIAEVMRQYPDCTFTDDDWSTDMYVRPITVPYAEVS